MRFKNKKRLAGYRTSWTRWFAWYPVSVEDEIVWLERVDRCYYHNYTYINGDKPPYKHDRSSVEWHYRLPV